MVKYEDLKDKIEKAINEKLADAIEINDYLADNPEVAAEEFKSSKKVVDYLRSQGFDVEYPYMNIQTAFKGTFGKGGHKYKAAVLAEYDALPEIGHACGHCLSCAMSVLAATVLKDFQDELDCDIAIFGTPEEEVDGAKCRMVDNGAFDGYDFAIMVHLYDRNLLYCKLLALNSFLYTFHGKAAHAAAAPWEGINALNGAQLMMHAVDMLRQHVTPDVRMHAVYRNGGAAPNIVPEEASIEIFARALDRPYLNKVLKKIDDCAYGAAQATQSTVDVFETSHQYDNLVPYEEGIKAIDEVFGDLGIEYIKEDHDEIFGSSDIGNVSFACPTFHPTLKLVERGIKVHTREFVAAVKTPAAYENLERGANVIALSIAKVFTDEERVKALRERTKAVKASLAEE